MIQNNGYCPVSKQDHSGIVLVSLAVALAISTWHVTACAEGNGNMLQVTVGNVQNSRGHIRLDVCTRQTFLHDSCPFHASAPARVGTVTITLQGLPLGTYAVQAFHDESDSGQVKRSLLGIPEEGIGFSRDAPLHIRGPSFANASFQLLPSGGQVSLRLRHLN